MFCLFRWDWRSVDGSEYSEEAVLAVECETVADLGGCDESDASERTQRSLWYHTFLIVQCLVQYER